MQIERKCLQCRHAVEAEERTVEQRLKGEDMRLCVAAPPCAVLVSTPQGPAAVAIYPQVNALSVSCSWFVLALQKGGQ